MNDAAAHSVKHSGRECPSGWYNRAVHEHTQHYVAGAWVDSNGKGAFDVHDAATEAVLGRVPAGDEADIERAVRAASDAFPVWAATSPVDRARYLERIAKGLAERMDDIAHLASREVGMPLKLARPVQAGLAIGTFHDQAARLGDYEFESTCRHSLVVEEPVGVVGAITPWNYPLHQVAGKVAPALAAGCTVVLKPSEVAPLTAYLLAEVIDQVGLPPGVFNLVCGAGPVVGEALARHASVDMISFTGSTAAGRRVSAVAAETLKRVAVELGGKSASLVLEDADFERAIKSSVSNAFFNSGQTCSAWTRLLVPRSREDEAIALAKAAAERFTLGDPADGATKLGPLASDAQRTRVRAHIQAALDEGATLVTGGVEPPEGLAQGYFVRPTVFAHVKPQMKLAREEVFGPVLAILAYDDEDEGVRLANDSIYGLAGGVWSGDPERALRVARRIRAGQIDLNGANFNPVAPFGGYKQSGNGREFGVWGLREFLEVKSIQR